MRTQLLRVLADEVVPLYYDRDPDGVPRGWAARMKRAIHTLGWRFNADRMVMDYVRHCYLPAAGGLSSDMGRRLDGVLDGRVGSRCAEHGNPAMARSAAQTPGDSGPAGQRNRSRQATIGGPTSPRVRRRGLGGWAVRRSSVAGGAAQTVAERGGHARQIGAAPRGRSAPCAASWATLLLPCRGTFCGLRLPPQVLQVDGHYARGAAREALQAGP